MILRKKSCAIMAYALAFFAMLLTQTSCVYDNNSAVLCDSEDTEALVINLNLTVPSSSAGTRSAGDDVVPGSKDENYINITDEDYQVLMFDKEGTLVEGKLSEFECKENGVNGGMTSYTLTAKLSLSSNEDKVRLSKFRVMVLANWKSFERSNTRPSYDTYPKFTGYNITPNAEKNIFNNGTDFNFTFKELIDNFSWVPSINKKQAIPMFGITEDLDLQFVMDMSKYGDGPSFKVPMLRAMAKVEIIDELGERIGSVSMSNANKSGRFIPDIEANSGWSTSPVVTPSLPTDAGTISTIEFVQGPDSNEKRTWVAYIPEMDLTEKRPEFTIYDGTTELEPTPFNNYDNDGKVVTDDADYLQSVLRNHIYSFRVTISDKAKVSMELEVLPWDMEYDDTPSYFDSPEVAKWLKWKTEYDEDDNVDDDKIGEPNEFLDDEDNLILTMKPATDEYAQATFTLVAPKNCRWYAQLQPLGGSSDAFYFVDADGKAIVTDDGKPGNPEGIIDKDGNGTECTIRIKNSSVTVNNRPNEAKLMVFVEYPDKTNREVKVVVGKLVYGEGDSVGKWVDNYTIYQEQTDLYD